MMLTRFCGTLTGMRRVLGWLILILVVGLGYLAWPRVWPSIQADVRQAQKMAALMRAPAPKHLPNPLPGSHLTDTWGAARSEGRRHEGIDIFARRNTSIRATTAGIVLNVGPDRLGGRTVMVLGPGQQRHYYAHLERYPALKRGDWVERGAVVGYVGDSGNAKGTPTHLHYGIYTARGAINPYPLLVGKLSYGP